MDKENVTFKKKDGTPAFNRMVFVFALILGGAIFFLSRYQPAPSTSAPQITFEEKMARLESGTPLTQPKASLVIPRWMMALILIFVVIQTLPLLMAARKARRRELTFRQIRQIEFLAETPLFLGLLGSLLGVCLTQFLSGTLAAPLAYFTTISGILLFLFGRFTILVSLPSSNDLS